ncbi:hypothetical protein ACDW_33160 [Acidovorax sp. DW039]|uniref:hypothetical protein n=1 Tax=Acidovorax sp. DW039 TaxID=3095606 RepID=UPI0030904FEA|nr:hypothetical protein ACDW_33160 [Acidovorax sp. DW039]
MRSIDAIQGTFHLSNQTYQAASPGISYLKMMKPIAFSDDNSLKIGRKWSAFAKQEGKSPSRPPDEKLRAQLCAPY